MNMSLAQVLNTAGKLDDLPGDDTGRERFRRFLRETAPEIGQLRDYTQECLGETGDEYRRSLQDLINYIGCLLEFEVTFGWYQGDFDGLWKSPSGLHVVVEIKTSGVGATKTAALVGEINYLISDKRIPSAERVLGLYVVNCPELELRRLANAIVAEKKTDFLRVMSVESLLSLAETMAEYDISHDEILAVMSSLTSGADAIVEPAELHSILRARDLD